MKVTAHKARAAGGGGAGGGAALAAIVVWYAEQQGVDMGGIEWALAIVIGTFIGGASSFVGAYFGPSNQEKP